MLLAHAARHDHLQLLTVLPLGALLLILDRDRSARIAQAQHRLELVGRERTRLQAAVRRLGDAFAAKLDLPRSRGIVLHGSVEALDAEAGRVTLEVRQPLLARSTPPATAGLTGLLESAGEIAWTSRPAPASSSATGSWALALPFGHGDPEGTGSGTLDSGPALARVPARRAGSDDGLGRTARIRRCGRSSTTRCCASRR